MGDQKKTFKEFARQLGASTLLDHNAIVHCSLSTLDETVIRLELKIGNGHVCDAPGATDILRSFVDSAATDAPEIAVEKVIEHTGMMLERSVRPALDVPSLPPAPE